MQEQSREEAPRLEAHPGSLDGNTNQTIMTGGSGIGHLSGFQQVGWNRGKYTRPLQAGKGLFYTHKHSE